MTKTILFVDEEAYARKALQRAFRDMHDQWEMRFAADPGQALEMLAAASVDVLITEMVFAGRGGLDFLETVRRDYPHAVRIVLSGYADRNVLLKSADLAHQYIVKPCDDDTLKTTISRAFMLKELLDQAPFKQVITRIGALPSLPARYEELAAALNDAEASVQQVADIVAKEPGLVAKLLQLVNSSFFGRPQRVTSAIQAVGLLGLDLVRAVVLASSTFDQFKKLKLKGITLDAMWAHAAATAAMAKTIAQAAGLDARAMDTAFTGGLLHDIGKLLIAAYLSGPFKEITAHMRREAVSMAAAEMAIIGTTHAAVGAYLLGLWGLPESLVNAVAGHHEPGTRGSGTLDMVAITHIANGFANAGKRLADPGAALDALDYGFLDSAGLSEAVVQWRLQCARLFDAERP
jgi:putative nucleotidyltransferase with HDIG domain